VPRPAQNDPDRLPDFLAAETSQDWDLEASVMPWAAGHLQRRDASNLNEAQREPLLFLPTSQQINGEEQISRQLWPSETDAPCYVILFGVGEEDVEGIYTLRTSDIETSTFAVSSVDTVVAFESEIDAQRFATLLEASLTHKPCVYPISWPDVTEWCNDNNTRCRLEPSGSLLIPPESNVERTDWERALALQRGEYKVLAAEPIFNQQQSEEIITSESAFSPSSFFIDAPDGWTDDYEDEESEELSEHDSFIGVGSTHRDHVATSVNARLAETNMDGIIATLERLMSQ
jgi:Protein of unknown function (DUF3110)